MIFSVYGERQKLFISSELLNKISDVPVFFKHLFFEQKVFGKHDISFQNFSIGEVSCHAKRFLIVAVDIEGEG